MKTASAISTGLHAAVILYAVVSFSGKAFDVTPVQSMPVDIVSDKDFSEMMKGVKNASKAETPKPFVEKPAEQKPADDPKPKVSEKKEIQPAADKAPQPDVKQPDPIADKLKKEEKQQEAKADQPLPPKKPEKPEKKQPKFEPDKIAALLDKRDPTRNAATGDTPNEQPTLGTAMGNAKQLSQSEIDALRSRLMSLWNPPVGIENPEQLIIRVRIRLNKDGKLNGPPIVLSSGNGPMFATARDSAIRAVFRGQPFDMLKPEHYETWKDIEVTFDPKDMFRG